MRNEGDRSSTDGLYIRKGESRLIGIYGVQLALLPDKNRMFSSLESYLGSSWRERHRSVRDNRASYASLGGVLLLRYAGLEGVVTYGEGGRPYLEGSRVDFNITHTEHEVFCAVAYPEDFCSRTAAAANTGALGAVSAPRLDPVGRQGLFDGVARVGLDAENLSRIASVRVLPLADRWFSETEEDAFLSAPSDRSFLQIWTRKEALVKWLGTGLAGLRRSDTSTAEAQYGVRFREYCEGDAVITLCTHAAGELPDRIHMLTRDEIEETLQKS